MTITPRFDEVIHAPNRLRICAALAAVTEVEFSTLRDSLGVSDPVLSKHLRRLQDAGYIVVKKPTGRGGRVRTWISLTARGRRAFRAHVAELHRLTSHVRTEPAHAAQPSTSRPALRTAVRDERDPDLSTTGPVDSPRPARRRSQRGALRPAELA